MCGNTKGTFILSNIHQLVWYNDCSAFCMYASGENKDKDLLCPLKLNLIFTSKH